jgi:saccharopine dehydrogenase-like NADP-dependent oxidoreductase
LLGRFGRQLSGRILIVGGYGAFGAHVAQRLARQTKLEIIIAGRSAERAAAFASRLARTADATISHAVVDATNVGAAEIKALGARVTVNASGPFQVQNNYPLARACIEARSHYVDLADARAFVTGIKVLDQAARKAKVYVISGASSVPGVSSAVVCKFAGSFRSLDTVEIGISPGNSFDPGEATAMSILRQLGKPFPLRRNGREEIAYGWQGLRRHSFPEIGTRWMCDVEVPDLDLLPAHYPSLQTARFSAGVEVGLFHLGLWSLSWLVRAGLARNPAALAKPLLAAKRRLGALGSDRGGMFVRMLGTDKKGRHQELSWHLIAPSGHGPYVPGIAAVILARNLIAGQAPASGAQPCFGLITLSQFEEEVADLDISCTHIWH